MKSKMVGMFAVLIIALMLIGVSYAMWSKTLYISGYVETGYVDAKFVSAFSNDDGKINDPSKDPNDDGTDPGYDKNVAVTYANVVTDSPDMLEVKVDNAYPCYSSIVWFEIGNTGTIPLKIQSVKLIYYDEQKEEVAVELTPCTLASFNLDRDGDDDITLHVTGITLGQQIDPDSWTGVTPTQGDLHIHIEQGAKQSANFKFLIEIDLVQWNEYAPP